MTKGKADSAILIVLIAGIFWSFGALVVRFIEDEEFQEVIDYIEFLKKNPS